jgi:hypothetical protein
VILNVLSQVCYLVTVLLIGADDMQREQIARRIDRYMRFAALRRLAPS